ncbi:ATP-binding protein [Sulfuriferula nivalis]|uniref:histidine kinase n=1 Tax=Sulfuriferula nivalis TaxID=2675298 RepID=A0A809S7E7_9PROT|nr:ATP-binding protein [Sulfuriferula nivalis]BBO99722.1 hypothetical protein SFSGTM_04310 [Sulfuriferula nivalis]
MQNIPCVHSLIMEINAITDFKQFIPSPSESNEEFNSLISSFNSLLERLYIKYEMSNREANSLAAGSIRMVVMADVQERLSQADKLVKTSSDIKRFFEEVLGDLQEATGSKNGIYVSLDNTGAPKGLVSPNVNAAVLAELKSTASFRDRIRLTFAENGVISQNGMIGGVPEIMEQPMLLSPVQIGGNTVGVFVLLGRVEADCFSRDDITMFEQLMPDVTRVLERLDLLRALEHSNRSLHAERLKLQVLVEQLNATQSQLMQSEKMASVGQLAAGVAHEINNPIGFVYSNLGTLEKYLENLFEIVHDYELAESAIVDGDVLARLQITKQKLDLSFLKEDLPALMGESKDGITRVKKIVQDLKDFSHVDVVEEWEYADLQKGIDTTLNIVNNEIKYKAEVVKNYGGIPEIKCLSSQLNQVFMNLFVNAAHAIEDRGTITIRTGQEGEEVWVEVVDTGKGIAPENLKRIFDPFFTTKPIGKGTGLGLSMAYGIIQKHHGKIEVQSEVGKGTTFRICLPINQ